MNGVYKIYKDGQWIELPMYFKGDNGGTPLLKIENNSWMVSYDNGDTWNSLGDVDITAQNSIVIGSNSKASIGSIALGDNIEVSGKASVAVGLGITVKSVKDDKGANRVFASGNSTEAYANNAHVEGDHSVVLNGVDDNTNGQAGHAEGQYTTVCQQAGHAEGRYTCAFNEGTHAEGGYMNKNTAGITLTKVAGVENTYQYSGEDPVVGTSTWRGVKIVSVDTKNKKLVLDGPLPDTYPTTFSDKDAPNKDKWVFATRAEGVCSHAEGDRTVAGGDCSHSGGAKSVANSNCAFVHGKECTAGLNNPKSSSNVSMGYQCHADGDQSVALGRGNIVQNTGEFACGTYNSSSSDTIFSVGNGTASNRKNALEIKSDGTIYINLDGNYVSLQELLSKIKNL